MFVLYCSVNFLNAHFTHMICFYYGSIKNEEAYIVPNWQDNYFDVSKQIQFLLSWNCLRIFSLLNFNQHYEKLNIIIHSYHTNKSFLDYFKSLYKIPKSNQFLFISCKILQWCKSSMFLYINCHPRMQIRRDFGCCEP